MEGELVNDGSPSVHGGGVLPPPRPKYSKVFWENLPAHLSYGMTADEYWNGPARLAEAYREAEKMRLERDNYLAWMHGLYTYDALGAISPILRAFAKRGTRPSPYVEEPYPLTRQRKEQTDREHEKAVMEKGKARMIAFMEAQKNRLSKGSNNTDETGKEAE